MDELQRLPLSVLDSFPESDTAVIESLYEEEISKWDRKVVVLDDDPTGVQTVHDISVYTDWSYESLKQGMEEENNLFFVLTNSRSFSAGETEEEHRVLARRALKAASDCQKGLLMVSRGDSTLRGHYPLELEAMKEELEQGMGRRIDGQILCPYFKEGGRYTIHSVHYVKEGEWLVPAGQTEFAKDRTFGYHASHLGDYVEEKSGGRYRKEDGIYITLDLLRAGAYDEITRLLCGAKGFQPVLADAISEWDIKTLVICLLRAIRTGKEFLVRSAAALPKVLGHVEDRPLLTREELVNGQESHDYGGIVLIGSHVKKTTLQLEELKTSGLPLTLLEFQVNACLEEGGLDREKVRIIREAEQVMANGRTAVVYTSRTLLTPEGASKEELLRLSVEISDAVTGVIAGLGPMPRFLIAKGGITSSDVGTKALGVKKALVLGQVQPGIPVWQTGEESKFPGLSYIIFPGNVGETDTLKKIVELLA